MKEIAKTPKGCSTFPLLSTKTANYCISKPTHDRTVTAIIQVLHDASVGQGYLFECGIPHSNVLRMKWAKDGLRCCFVILTATSFIFLIIFFDYLELRFPRHERNVFFILFLFLDFALEDRDALNDSIHPLHLLLSFNLANCSWVGIGRTYFSSLYT